MRDKEYRQKMTEKHDRNRQYAREKRERGCHAGDKREMRLNKRNYERLVETGRV